MPGDTGAESPREQPSRVCALRRQASRLPNAGHIFAILRKCAARKTDKPIKNTRPCGPRVFFSSVLT
ncbi:hypothetical protein DWV16_13445 [Anaerotruncus sp. AF02-27]|nr:hypothetical protein DWV16_13445 [Anaerotruncus sp. AF02-27]